MLDKHSIQLIRQFNREYTERLGLLNRHVFDSDLSWPVARVLLCVYHDAGTTPQAISRQLGLDKSYTSRMIKQLVQAGLVDKQVAPDDGRSRILTVTDRGHQVGEQLDRRSNEQVQRLFANCPPGEQEKVILAFETLNRFGRL